MSEGFEVIQESQLKQEEFALYSPEAERGFPCCLMQKPDLISEAETAIEPSDHNFKLHRYMDEVMLSIHRRAVDYGWAVLFDPVSMLSAAQKMGAEQERSFNQRTDGLAKVREIEAMAPNVDVLSFAGYIDTIKDRATHVRIYQQARQMQQGALNLAGKPKAADAAVERRR